MKRVPLTAILVCVLSVATFSDPLLQRAGESERAGDLETSASLLAEWLSANPGASGSAEVFDSYLRVEQDFPKLLQTAAGFLRTGRGLAGAAPQFERIARLFDLSGRIEEARDAYLAAHAEGAPDAALVSAFLLSLRMNDTESMAAALQQLKGKSASSEILLQALSDLQGGERAAARAALVGLAEQTGNPDLALKSLWVLYQTAQGAGDTSGQSDARAKLRKRFASSPETALASGAPGPGSQTSRQIVVPAPAPDSFAPGAAPTQTSAPANPPPAVSGQPQSSSPPASGPAAPQGPTAPVVRFSVQAGSFQMKENADDLLLELTRRGFSATVQHDPAQGRDRYRVFAGSGLAQDAAEEVRTKLSADGFLGFLVLDK